MYNGDQADDFGLHNSEAVTMFVHDGQTEAGAFGVPLDLVLGCVVGYRDMESVTLTVTASGGYPAFAKVSVSHGVSVYRHNGSSYNVATATFAAISSDPVVKVFRAEGKAEVGGPARLGPGAVQRHRDIRLGGRRLLRRDPRSARRLHGRDQGRIPRGGQLHHGGGRLHAP